MGQGLEMKMYIYVDYNNNDLEWTLSAPFEDKTDAVEHWNGLSDTSCRTHLGRFIQLDLPKIIKNPVVQINSIPTLEAKAIK